MTGQTPSSTLLQGVGRGCGGGRGNGLPPSLPHNTNHSPPTNLTLIGTVHGDPAGYGRAWRLLESLTPDLITVEISPFSVRYRLKRERCWQWCLERVLAELPPSAPGHLAIRRLQGQVEMPFELRAGRDWGQAKGVPWQALDLGAPARRELPRYKTELLSIENLRALLGTEDGSLEDWVAGEYRRARTAWARAPWRVGRQEDEARRREAFQARRLRNLAARGARIVHLGGWEHLMLWQDGSGLQAALADLKPLALLLEDADFLPHIAGAGAWQEFPGKPRLDSEAISC
jgi:hypothetical protein